MSEITTKGVGTLPVQDAATEATHVLIEEGGAAMRIPAANLAPKVELPEDHLTYTPQELTPEQQAQARANIGAISGEDVPGLVSWDDLTDKPFGEEEGQVLIPEQSVTLSGFAVSEADVWVEPYIPIVAGNVYYLTIDGVVYEATAHATQYDNRIMFDPTNTPGDMAVIIDLGADYGYRVSEPGGGEQTFVLELKAAPTVKTLDEKYIPDTIQRVGKDVTLHSESGTAYTVGVSDDGEVIVTNESTGESATVGGRTVFYAQEGDLYLYVDSAYANKATSQQLEDAFSAGEVRVMYAAEYSTYITFPTSYYANYDYGSVVNVTDSYGQRKEFHAAEYVEEG